MIQILRLSILNNAAGLINILDGRGKLQRETHNLRESQHVSEKLPTGGQWA